MLEKIGEVPWSELSHCYGQATDLPELLLALASVDTDKRQQALHELYGTILHQGTIYEASSYAVPFLLELAANPDVQERWGCLSLIGAIAEGSSYWAVHKHSPAASSDLAPAEIQGMERRERVWVERAHRAVREGRPALFACLEDDDSLVSASSAYALSRLSDEADHLVSRLGARLERSEDERLQAALVHCMGALMDVSPIARDRTKRLFATSSSRFVTLVAAMTLSKSQGETVAGEVTNLLIDNILADDEIDHVYRWFPWDAGEATYDIIAGLARSSLGWQRAIAKLLDKAAAPNPDPRVEYAVQLLPLLAFHDNWMLVVNRTALSSRQSELLRALLDSEGIWNRLRGELNSKALASDLGGLGIPVQRQALADFVAGLPILPEERSGI